MRQSETNIEIQKKFKSESQYDINEIEKVYNFIYKKESDVSDAGKAKIIDFLLYDGKFGSGKSYKLDKAIEYATEVNKKSKTTTFDSFQSGFNDNFAYILLMRILKDESKYRNFKSRCKLACFSAKQWSIAMPISFGLTFTIYKFLGPIKFDIIPFFSTHMDFLVNELNKVGITVVSESNLGYMMLFVISYIITSFTLHVILTVKKGYTISNRDYYYDAILRTIGEVLIVDDFERLEANQRKQVYEFIDYCSKFKNIPTKSKLETIVLVGSHEHIKVMDEFKEVQSEPTVDKYFKSKLTIKSWTNTFVERLNAEHASKVLNKIEASRVESLLSYLEPVLSRRNFIRFLNEDLSDFSFKDMYMKSFSEQLIEYLNKEGIPIYNEKLDWWDYKDLVGLKGEFIDQFQEGLIPVYKTVDMITKDEVSYHPQASEVIKEIADKFPSVEYLSEFLNQLINNQKQKWDIEGYDIFPNYLEYENYKTHEAVSGNLLYETESSKYSINDYYKQHSLNLLEYKDDISNEGLNKGFIVELIRNYEVNESLRNLVPIIGNEIKSNTTIEEIEFELRNLFEDFEKFQANYIYSYISHQSEKYNIDECETAYKIACSKDATEVISNSTGKINKNKVINYVIQQENNSIEILSTLIASKTISSKDVMLEAYEYYKANRPQFMKYEKYTQEKSHTNYNYLRSIEFFDINYLTRILYKDTSVDLVLEIFEGVASFNEADSVYSNMINPNISSYNKPQLSRLVDVSCVNSQIMNRKGFKRQVIYINSVIDKKFNNHISKDIRSEFSGKVEIHIPQNRLKKFFKRKDNEQ